MYLGKGLWEQYKFWIPSKISQSAPTFNLECVIFRFFKILHVSTFSMVKYAKFWPQLYNIKGSVTIYVDRG